MLLATSRRPSTLGLALALWGCTEAPTEQPRVSEAEFARMKNVPLQGPTDPDPRYAQPTPLTVRPPYVPLPPNPQQAPPAVVAFYDAFRRAVLRRDTSIVAAQMRYPLVHLNIAGEVIHDAKEFVRRYDEVMSPELFADIEAHGSETLSARPQGPVEAANRRLKIDHDCPAGVARPCPDGPLRVVELTNISFWPGNCFPSSPP